MNLPSYLLTLLTVLLLGCGGANSPTTSQTAPEDTTKPALPAKDEFQATINGVETTLFYLEAEGIYAAVTDYGARLVSLWVQDHNGEWTDVALGFNKVTTFTEPGAFFYGATVGRYGNRIAKGQFSIDGQDYQVPINNAPNTLHGGPEGFFAQVWDADQPDGKSVTFTYVSPDGEMGYPGTLQTTVTYSLTDTPGLRIDYAATTDAPTVANITNHTYFNLNGEGSGTINDHLLLIPASRFTPVDSTLIPTGELSEVAGTPFDFQIPTTIGKRVEAEHTQLAYGKGYDHNFVLDAGKTDELHLAASVVGDQTDIRMDIFTNEPGIQFYGGNFMNGSLTGKSGEAYGYRSGFCLETQHYPDSPNQPDWPSTFLNPGEIYQTTTVHRFSVEQ